MMFLSDAGGVGLNLQRAAAAASTSRLPWNPAVIEQRIGASTDSGDLTIDATIS